MESKKLEQMKADFRGIIKRGPFYQGGAHAKGLGDELWNIDREGVFADAVEEGYLVLVGGVQQGQYYRRKVLLCTACSL